MVLNTHCRGFVVLGLRTRHYDIENIVVVETDVILMVECEICHKKEEWNGPNSNIYRFEPKRNYAEDLEDTEESDNTSSDDDEY